MPSHHFEQRTRLDEYDKALDEREPYTVLRIFIFGSAATLLASDVVAEGCAGGQKTFGEQLVRTRRTKRQWLMYLPKRFAARLTANCGTDFCLTAGEFRLECGQAQEFVERIRQFLVAERLTDRTLHSKHGDV